MSDNGSFLHNIYKENERGGLPYRINRGRKMASRDLGKVE